jgi:hypothetical protein
MTKGNGGNGDASTSAAEGASQARSKTASPPLPKVDFSTLVLSLGTTALYQLGLVSNPESHGTIEPDLLVAHQTIDTLEMLRDKTRGNLSEEEGKLIDSLLYELRMRFVEVEKGR